MILSLTRALVVALALAIPGGLLSADPTVVPIGTVALADIVIDASVDDLAPASFPDTVSARTVDTSSSPAVLDTILADVIAVGTDAIALFGAPLRFGARDWLVVGAGAAVFGVSFAADEPAREVTQRNRSTGGDDAAYYTNMGGTPAAAAIVGGGTWLAGLTFDWPAVRVAGRHVAQATLYSGAVTTLLKWLIGRQRPYAGEGNGVFVGPQSDDRWYSLPSGHSTAAFAISSSLAADIDHPLATVLLYGAATATAVGRVYTDRHWVSDIVLGAMIGTACGWGVATLDDGGVADGGSSWMVLPTGNGLAVAVTW